MDRKTEYKIYRQMFHRAQELQIKIEEHLIHKYGVVHTAFVSVGDEEKSLYFVDVEAGGSRETYFHYRGTLTEEQILKKFCARNKTN